MKTLLERAHLPRVKKIFFFFTLWLTVTISLLYQFHLIRNISEPYAEDGSSLFLSTLASPWNFFLPVVDGIFILPRLIATLCAIGSLSYYPQLMAMMSASILSLVALYVTRQSFSAIYPSICQRYLIALVIAGNVGTIEVGSQIMSSSYALSLLLVLLALEAPRIKARLLVPIVLILSFSTNISFIAAPLFFIRGSINRDNCSKLSGVLTLIPILINGLLATFYSNSPYSVSQFSD